MTKLQCKIIFIPDDLNHPIEIYGQIDKLQLTSQNCDWFMIESTYYLNKKLHTNESIISKQDIIKIVVYKENKQYAIDKDRLALNTHVLSFFGMET